MDRTPSVTSDKTGGTDLTQTTTKDKTDLNRKVKDNNTRGS